MDELTALPKTPQRTTAAFGFSTVQRALFEGLATRKFGATEKREVLHFFKMRMPQCVYCGSFDVKRWDHVVPIVHGGDTVLGNIVPSCQKCDDSKAARAFADWMRGGSPSSPVTCGVVDVEARISRIRSYAAHYRYASRAVQDRLDEDQLVEWTCIKSKLSAVQAEIGEFLAKYWESHA